MEWEKLFLFLMTFQIRAEFYNVANFQGFVLLLSSQLKRKGVGKSNTHSNFSTRKFKKREDYIHRIMENYVLKNTMSF